MTDGHSLPAARNEKRPLYRQLPLALEYLLKVLGPLREAAEAVQQMKQAPMALCAQSVLPAASLAENLPRAVKGAP